MGRFDGKVVFISGAARGQGRAHAVRFAQEGADVIAADACADHAGLGYAMASESDLAETVRLVQEQGRRIVARTTDVRSQQQLDELVAEGLSEFDRIDVVLANAGVYTWAENSWNMTEDEWNSVVDINLSGVWRTCKATIPAMVQGGRGGSILITASTAGYRSEPGAAAYAGAKLGLVGFSRALAGELGHHNIRVNTIHPSVVRTPLMFNDVIVPLLCPGETTETISEDDYFRRLEYLHELPEGVMTPEDVSEVMLFLASDAGRFMTACEVPTDGGYIRKVFDLK